MSDSRNDTESECLNGRELVESRANSGELSVRYKFVRLVRGNVTRTFGVIALLALLTVTAVAVPAPLPAAADVPSASQSTSVADEEANETVAAGEHLSGSLSVQRESVDRNLSSRTVTVTVERAPNEDAKADYLSGECDRVRRSMQALQQRALSLQRARSNGSITLGEFRSRMTELDARAQTVEQLTVTCLRSGRKISNESLDRSGFNVTAMRESRQTARTFRREELSGHTFNVTVRNVSVAVGSGYEVMTNESLSNVSGAQRELLVEATARRDLLVDQHEAATAFVDEYAPDDDDASESLSCAASELASAEDDIEAARQAAENGDDAAFSDHLSAAREHMDAAETCIETAYEEAGP